ncbi:tumor necrosis factor ligand superfamily member 15-like [Haliotis asinina]|uniref:tumor necrosis factor ligand superfamily member 15-like n=1 Tax=Haliotis asinina TaxID=109174 RepID=UPI0035319D48
MADTSDDSYLRVEHLQPHTEIQPIPRTFCTAKRVFFTSILVLSLSANAAFLLCWYRHHFKDATSNNQSVHVSQSEIRRNNFCTDCTDIGVYPDMGNTSDLQDLMVQTTSDSAYLCCLKNAQGRQMILNLFTDQSNNAPRTQEPGVHCVSSHKSGAHLYLNSDASKKSGSLEWTDEAHCSSFTNHSVIFDNNTLQIRQHGIYRIYSFLTLQSQHWLRQPDNIVHTMKRSTKSLPNLGNTSIIMAKKTLPEASGRFVTSYLSATVRLRQGDHVFVSASNVSYVSYPYPSSNFFGLFYVGE